MSDHHEENRIYEAVVMLADAADIILLRSRDQLPAPVVKLLERQCLESVDLVNQLGDDASRQLLAHGDLTTPVAQLLKDMASLSA